MAKNANIKVTADTKDATSKLKKLNGELNAMKKNDSLQKNYSELQKAGKNMTASTNVYAAIIMAVIGALKKEFQAIRETSAAYNEHNDIIKRLDIVATQSPYLSGQSVRNLQRYATELEKTTAVSKNVILQNIAELAATGKTEEHIMKIIGASVDYAAAKNIDLSTAVNQLNATLSGNVGTLGKQDKAFKALTKEELENGKAIDLIIEKYSGVAKETANTSDKLKNAQRNTKEQMGSVLTEVNDGFNLMGIKASEKFGEAFVKTFKSYLQGWISGEAPKFMGSLLALVGGPGTFLTGLSVGSMGNKLGLKQFNSEASKLNDAELNAYIGTTADAIAQRGYDGNLGLRDYELVLEKKEKSKKITAEERKLLQQIRFEIQNRFEREKALEQQRKIELKEQERLLEIENEKAEKKRKADEEALNIIDPINEAYQAKLRQINAEEKELKTITSEEAELKRLIALYERYENAAKMATDAGQSNFTFMNGTFQKWKTEYEEAAKNLGLTADEYKELENALNQFEKESRKSTKEILKDNLDFIASYQDKAKEGSELWEKLMQARIVTQKKYNEELEKEEKETMNKIIDAAVDGISKYEEMTSNIGEILTNQAEEQTEAALGQLSEQYTSGLIDYEEYCDKKAEISKQAAREQYKIDMFTWTSSLLSATASIAQGVASALSQEPPYSYIAAALTAAAGATQIASITASKPRPPQFASGGIVGATMGADNTIATIRTGEMVLNAMQQRQLWNMANGKVGMGGINVTINNTASDKVNASASMGRNGLTVVITDIVNSQMQKGAFTGSMNIAASKANGVNLL